MSKWVVVIAGLLLPVLAIADDAVLRESETGYTYSYLFNDQTDLSAGLTATSHAPDYAPFTRQLPALNLENDFLEPQPSLSDRFGFSALANFSALRNIAALTNFTALKNWVLGFRSGHTDLGVDFDDAILDEKLVLADTGLLFKPASNVGVGLHYTLFSDDGRFEDDNIIADINPEYKGPRLSFDLSF